MSLIFDSYDVLILGPGGMKGFIELGALKQFEDKDLLKNIKIFCGVSIGSIIALLLSCGYTIMEILQHASNTNLIDLNNMDMKNILSGLFNQNSFDVKLKNLIKEKLNINYIPTFAQLKELTGIEYSAIATVIDKPYPREVNMNFKTYPDLNVIDASLMSSNIPGLFKKIKYENKYYIDGGLSCPLPIKFYDNGVNKILSISILTQASDDKILENTINYMYISMNVPMLLLTQRYVSESSSNCTNLVINATLDNPMSAKINDKEKRNMFMLGYHEAKKLFSNCD